MQASFDNAGLSDIWSNNGGGLNTNYIKMSLKDRIRDCDLQNWRSDAHSNSQCTFYRMFKDELQLAKHMTLLSEKEFICYTRFICRNHKLPITKARFNNTEIENNPEITKCTLCDSNEVGDEYHYIFKCPHFDDQRMSCLGKKRFQNANIYSVQRFLKPPTRRQAKKLVHFITSICQTFKSQR